MTWIVYNKFEQNQDLRKILLKTGKRDIIEASCDTISGIGFEENEADAKQMYWGENLLGQSLMDVRGLLSYEANFRNSPAAQNNPAACTGARATGITGPFVRLHWLYAQRQTSKDPLARLRSLPERFRGQEGSRGPRPSC